MPKRSIKHTYHDPVDLIWLRAAADLGLTVQRSTDAYAAYDGQGTLTISVADEFDPDDCLAQMIFHELCHWLVSGAGAWDLPDWGLSNTSRRDLVYEYACHRLQAALAAPYG
ncbi:MAG: YkgJ family cysteine cluster protein, partial [Planctomycetaceae bacterium]